MQWFSLLHFSLFSTRFHSLVHTMLCMNVEDVDEQQNRMTDADEQMMRRPIAITEHGDANHRRTNRTGTT
jgi:hypothetical protein